MAYPTATGNAVEGAPLREPQVCLGPKYAQATYQFFLTGTSTPANVYQDGNLTVPFPITGFVTADNFGRFPPIYLDTSIIYKVQFYNSNNQLVWTLDPYTPPLATTGTSSNTTTGPKIATTGEVTVGAPSAGGTGITLTLKAGALGTAALKVSSPFAGQAAIIVNSSATTGAHTATFTATNKPGTATSSPAGWLPIICDGVTYFTPIWHGNNFTPYVPTVGPVGDTLVGEVIEFNGDGSTSVTAGTSVQGSWYLPNTSGIGASYYISLGQIGGNLTGILFGGYQSVTAAPSGTYTGGTLSTAWTGATSNNYYIQTYTGQLIVGCTFTNGSTAFTCPSTAINGSPIALIFVGIPSATAQNITSGGLVFRSNSGDTATTTYTISNNISGTPALASGTITINNSVFGPTGANWNVSAPLVLNDNGTSTADGNPASPWSNLQPYAGQGANYFIYITQTGGTPGYSFSAATVAPRSISSGGLTIDISGPTGTSYYVTGNFQISLDSAGDYVVATGNITLNGGTPIQSPNYIGAPQLALLPNGTAFLNGAAASNWYSPTTPGVGPGYWFGITRTGGTAGVNFTNAQGVFVNIGGSGLVINLSGYTGDVGSAYATGTWQISNSSGGSPVLGSGTITLTVSGLTVIHIYTSGSGVEFIPTGTTNVAVEGFGSGAGGGAGFGSGLTRFNGGGGGGGGYNYTTHLASVLGGAGKTFNYTVGVGGPAQSAGTNTVISAGTVTSFATMTAETGTPGTNATGSGNGTGGPGGPATGGDITNTTGNAGTSSGAGGAGLTGSISGDGSPYGPGGTAGFGSGAPGSPGNNGAAVFYYS